MFDTAVRERRQHTPWARINLVAFMREMLWNAPYESDVREHATVLRVSARPSVASREWWTLEWTTATGQRGHVEAQYVDLLLWRAAEHEMQQREREEAKDRPPAAREVEISMEASDGRTA
jgi:hypothetical protein